MDLDRYRKDAKRLVRAMQAGDPDACSRAEEVLGARARERFQLSDALHVIATERGYRSWPEMKRSLAPAEPEHQGDDELITVLDDELATVLDPNRTETAVESELCYRPGEPVVVVVARRERRVSVSDGGVAVEKAARPPGWRAPAARLERELDVNVSRGGQVWLPVVAAGPGLDAIVRRIAEASLTLYQTLLDLDQ